MAQQIRTLNRGIAGRFSSVNSPRRGLAGRWEPWWSAPDRHTSNRSALAEDKGEAVVMSGGPERALQGLGNRWCGNLACSL